MLLPSPLGIVSSSSIWVGEELEGVGHKSSSVANAETGDKEGDGNAEFGLSITPRFSIVVAVVVASPGVVVLDVVAYPEDDEW